VDQVRKHLACLFDTNVILDILLNRAPWVSEASRLLEAAKTGKILSFVSASAITDIFYVCRKVVGTTQARVAIETCLSTFKVIPVDEELLHQAVALPINDLEDALQVACAIRAKLDMIVTRDSSGFINSTVPIVSPSDLIARLQQHAEEHTPTAPPPTTEATS
jgi:predicted nucleic acid-binding protein